MGITAIFRHPLRTRLPLRTRHPGWALTKISLLVILSAVIAFVLFYAMSRKAAVVPGRLQFVGEYAYGFVRNSIARDNIGSHDFMKFVPYLFTIFLFILVNNFTGSSR